MIDWARVDELRNEIGEDDFGEVVDLFLTEVDGVIAILAPGMPGLEEQLHFLKGSALSLGFADFSSLCASGEVRAAGGQDISADLASLLTCYAASRAHFLSELPGRLAA